MNDEQVTERDVLAATFQARVLLAKQSREGAAQEADTEWVANKAWFKSPSRAPGSFLWFCQEFDLDAGAVRKQVGA